MAPSKVLIVGAGITGLVLALSLLQNGIPVRIIDKVSSYRVGCKGSCIQPRTLEIYQQLGLFPELLAISIDMPSAKVHLPNGQSLAFEMASALEDFPSRPYDNPVILSQYHHEEFLRNRIQNYYGCQVELGTELVSFEQDERGVVARLKKNHAHASNAEEIFWTPYLVGADGGQSVVRKIAGLRFRDDTKSEGTAVVGDVYVKSGTDPNSCNMWGDRSTTMVLLRADGREDGRYSFMVVATSLDLNPAASSRENFIRAFQHATGTTAIVFGDLIWLSQLNFRMGMLETFQSGRVFVAGGMFTSTPLKDVGQPFQTDACHVYSPVDGEGLNASVQDAFNLGWKLALVLKGLSPRSLLETYSLERVPVVAAMLRKTSRLSGKTTVENIRTAAPASFASDVDGSTCRGSRIIVDDYASAGEVVDSYNGIVRAGDRAPDTPGLLNECGEVTTLFNSGVFASNVHTVLAFAQHPPRMLMPVPNPGLVKVAIIVPQGSPSGFIPGGRVLVDSEGFIEKQYRVKERDLKFVVVRPDGVIGALAKGTDGLNTYFRKIFV